MKSFEIGQRVRVVDPEYLLNNGLPGPVEGIVTAIDEHEPFYVKGHASIELVDDARNRSFIVFPSGCEVVETKDDKRLAKPEEKKKAYEGTPAIGALSSQGFLRLAMLYLETYSQLAEEDKQLYRRLIHALVNPLLKYKEAGK